MTLNIPTPNKEWGNMKMNLQNNIPSKNHSGDMSLAPYTHLPNSINELLFGEYINDWVMQHEERLALISLLSKIRPECAIEIGTKDGGSLSAIAKFSKKIYTIDIDPTCSERIGRKFSNVEFIIGPSEETLIPLIQRLQEANVGIEFILIDGNHTRQAVRQDIENLLHIVRPTLPLYVVLHDSFSPECRQGMIEANWGANPYVHFVELDFITGRFEPNYRMTCGFALALLLPFRRNGNLNIHEDRALKNKIMFSHSIHRSKPWKSFMMAFKRKMKSLLK